MKSTVCKLDKCTGCNACVSICPKKCITIEDSVSSINAIINTDICINCDLCKKVCQVNNPDNKLINLNKTINSYDGFSKDTNTVKTSSSGGFATTLYREFIKSGGYVVGLTNRKSELNFELTNDIKDIDYFKGSKYVKVLTNDIYISIKNRLKTHKVLFIGLPCQVAGLKLFLQKDYGNLYTVDLICHGTPSMKVLNKYLNEVNINTQNNISFRNKDIYTISVNNKYLFSKRASDPYSIGFANCVFFTNNCYECHFATPNRVGDITIGDSWGSKNTGVNGVNHLSLILCQTDKSKYLLDLLKDSFTFIDCDYENALKNNKQLNKPSQRHNGSFFYFENFNNLSTKKIIKTICRTNYYKQILKKLIIFKKN